MKKNKEPVLKQIVFPGHLPCSGAWTWHWKKEKDKPETSESFRSRQGRAQVSYFNMGQTIENTEKRVLLKNRKGEKHIFMIEVVFFLQEQHPIAPNSASQISHSLLSLQNLFFSCSSLSPFPLQRRLEIATHTSGHLNCQTGQFTESAMPCPLWAGFQCCGMRYALKILRCQKHFRLSV